MATKEKTFWPNWPVKIDEKGVLHFQNRVEWDRFKIPYYGKDMVLVLKTPSKDRSRQEEKFYHAVVVAMVAEEMDLGRQEAHEFLKGLFLRVEGRTTSGFRYERVMSTTELTDRQYRSYWEKCIQWAAQPTWDDGLGESSGLGLIIPYPNEVWYDQPV